MQFMPPTTPTPVSTVLTPDADGLKRVAVVGNGPLSSQDRLRINNHRNVVRFNDYFSKNWVSGDRITIHCSSIDQFTRPWAVPNATKWAVASQLRHLNENSTLYTWNMNPSQVRWYSTRFFWTVALGIEPVSVLAPWFDTYRLFANCSACGDRCLNKNTDSGFSRGAIALNALEEDPGVSHIDVYGMNWMGADGHVDFVYPTIVRECCIKCTIHGTPTMEYGGLDKRPVWQRRLQNSSLAHIVPVWLVLGVAVWVCLQRRRRRQRRHIQRRVACTPSEDEGASFAS